MKITNRDDRRQRIKYRIRKRVRGTAAQPRLSVFRSVSHIYVQVIDDLAGQTLVFAFTSASSVEAEVKAKMTDGARAGNNKGASVVGETIAERLKSKGISKVVFDRNGFLYHGRVREVAEAARKAGLEF
jgi:large subunit ribosomal protein L18